MSDNEEKNPYLEPDDREGTLPEVQKRLKAMILEDVDEAWKFLKDNPIAAIGMTKVKRELAQNMDSENVQKFYELYETEVKDLFILRHKIDTLGIPLLVEIMTENWRRNFEGHEHTTLNDLLYNNLEMLWNVSQKGKAANDIGLTSKMVADFRRRIYDLETYENEKLDKFWNVLQGEFYEGLESLFSQDPGDDIPNNWHAILFMLTMSPDLLVSLQKNMSSIVYELLNKQFSTYSETFKFQIAPWLLNLQQKTGNIGNNEPKSE